MSDSNYNKCRFCNCYYSSMPKLEFCIDCVCEYLIRKQEEIIYRDVGGLPVLASPSLVIVRYSVDNTTDAIQELEKSIQLIKEGLKSHGI